MPNDLDPDNLFYGLEPSELALLNKDRAVMVRIGKVFHIFIFFNDGIIEINDGNFNTLNLLSGFDNISDLGSLDGLDNIQGYTNSLSDDCKERNNEREIKRVGGNIRIKAISKIKMSTGVTYFKWKLKIKSQKKTMVGWLVALSP